MFILNYSLLEVKCGREVRLRLATAERKEASSGALVSSSWLPSECLLATGLNKPSTRTGSVKLEKRLNEIKPYNVCIPI